MINVVVSAVNVLFLLGILYVYLRNFSGLKSKLVFGLMAFACIFMIQNLTAIYVFFQLAASYRADVAVPMLALNVLESGALALFLWLTWR